MNKDFNNLIHEAQRIVVIQAENPDADSLGSAIALESILTTLSKEVSLYCKVNIPDYLRYLTAWSRVSSELPVSFDLSIIVDTSSNSLLERLTDAERKKIAKSQVIVIDHHDSDNSLPFNSSLTIIDPSKSSSCEIIYDLNKGLKTKLQEDAIIALGSGILADTLGLMTIKTSSDTIRIIADLVDQGLNLTSLDNIRKESYRKSLELTKYKGELLQRIETYSDSKIALLEIPYHEIIKYSPIYNPAVLVMEDMKLIKQTAIAIVLKLYNDQRITAKIRSNYNYPIANELANEFGGGGHQYSSGFKTYDYPDINILKQAIIKKATNLIKKCDENI